MAFRVKNQNLLSRILWWDFILGFSAGLAGLLLYKIVAEICGLMEFVILFISSVTLVYSLFAFYLASRKEQSAILVRYLVLANWFWTIVSLVILFFHAANATILGLLFIIGQILIVGGLAYLEGRQLEKNNT